MRSLILIALFSFIGTISFAQEVQVPLDVAGEMMVIDREFARSAGLFADVSGFREARLFRSDGDQYVLEITYIEDDQTLRRRDDLTADEVSALRASVQRHIEQRRASVIDQSGRPYLLRRTAFMSYLVYGPSLAGALNIEDGGTAAAVALLTGSAGFFVPFLMTRDRPVPMPAARAAFAGSTLGYVHGIAVAAVIGGEGLTGRGAVGSGLAFSVSEAIAGYNYGLRTNIGDGHARLMTTGGWVGMGMGAMTGLLIAGEGQDFEEVDADTEIRLTAGLSLLGSGVGIYAGNRLGSRGDYTLGDASVLASATGLGAYTGLATAAVFDTDLRPGMAITLAGTAAGLYAGYALTQNTNFTESQANYIDLGAGAGFLLGAGIAQLVAENDDTAFMIASALGTIGGFAVMYGTYRPEAAANPSGSGWRFEIGPVPGTIRPGLNIRHRW